MRRTKPIRFRSGILIKAGDDLLSRILHRDLEGEILLSVDDLALKSGRRRQIESVQNKKPDPFGSGFLINRATSCSPTHLRVQYNRG
jgi:hypothetical protein